MVHILPVVEGLGGAGPHSVTRHGDLQLQPANRDRDGSSSRDRRSLAQPRATPTEVPVTASAGRAAVTNGHSHANVTVHSFRGPSRRAAEPTDIRRRMRMFMGHGGPARGSRQAVTVPLPPSVEAVEPVPEGLQFAMPLRLALCSRRSLWLADRDRRPHLTCWERAVSGCPSPQCQSERQRGSDPGMPAGHRDSQPHSHGGATQAPNRTFKGIRKARPGSGLGPVRPVNFPDRKC